MSIYPPEPSADQLYQQSLPETIQAVGLYCQALASLKPGDWHWEVAADYDDYDFTIYKDGLPHHYLEVKVRNYTMFQFEQTAIPIRKHAVAKHNLVRYKRRTYFLGVFLDGLAVLDLTQDPDKEEIWMDSYKRSRGTYAKYNTKRFKVIKLPNSEVIDEEPYTLDDLGKDIYEN